MSLKLILLRHVLCDLGTLAQSHRVSALPASFIGEGYGFPARVTGFRMRRAKPAAHGGREDGSEEQLRDRAEMEGGKGLSVETTENP